MRRACIWIGLAWLASAVTGFIAVAPSATAQGRPSVNAAQTAVQVLETKGQVRIIRGSDGRILDARRGMTLAPGDRFETGLNSRATLDWYGQGVMPVGPLARLVITPPAGAKKRAGFNLLRGLIYFLHRDKPRELELNSPGGWAVILGTEFSVSVEENGRTTISVFDGEVEWGSPQGTPLQLRSREQAVAAPGEEPRKTAVVVAGTELIQWCLYYPGVLDVDEAGLTSAEQATLADSITAYRTGDLPAAVAAYPAGREPASDSERIYLAALLLAVGQVETAQTHLAAVAPSDAKLAAALRKTIAAVQGRDDASLPDAGLATSMLADSYHQQSRAVLTGALASARAAVRLSPQFAFGWARVAELEFSFGHTEKASEALEKSLALAPRNAHALAVKGFLLSAQNRIGPAITAFEDALAVDAALGNAWLGRGLCQIRRGRTAEGLHDLLAAAALEPQRAVLRSYLGKAFQHAGDTADALKELRLARQLDPNDPTAWLYSALLLQQENRISEAVRDLERSTELNDHRRVYRSAHLLEQDEAVRGANLATLYLDAAMPEVSFREAAQAVAADYANYSAHWFLANSYNQLRDPNGVNLRYETPWLSEYLVANLLAPVHASTLSQLVSQQEYSRLFERDRFGLVSSTDYASRGAWQQAGAHYGLWGRFGYVLEANYRNDPGQYANNDREDLTLSLQLKGELSPRDSLYFQVAYYEAEGGDLSQHYAPSDVEPQRFRDHQEPLLLAGYHHEWAPGSHSLFLASRQHDRLEVTNQMYSQVLFGRPTNGAPVNLADLLPVGLDYESELEIYSIEAQQLFQRPGHSAIVGVRYQDGQFETRSDTTAFFGGLFPATATNVEANFGRFSAYTYYHWQPIEPLVLIGGVAYDRLTLPRNLFFPPVTGGEETLDQVSPKAGLVWTPARRTTIRAAYSQSLQGASIDQSYRLEPSQLAGFSQSFGSILPESAAGPLPGARIENWGVALDQTIGSGTYVGLSAEWLKADGRRHVGNPTAVGPDVFFPDELVRTDTPESLDYEEPSLTLTLNQLVGREWSFGVRYRVSYAELRDRFNEVAAGTPQFGGFTNQQHLEATLHQVMLHATYNHASGFFARAEALWYAQNNDGYSPPLPSEEFWQFNLFAGYRFPRRRAEVRLGLLNLAGDDYRLNPLNLTPELPRERTFTASFRFNF